MPIDNIKEVPLEKFNFGKSDLDLRIVRGDLNHDKIQGNKWWKLSENLNYFRKADLTEIISFGGAFSNHIYALSSACSSLSIPLQLYVRANDIDLDNPTMRKVVKDGTSIQLLSFDQYRNKDQKDFLEKLKIKHPKAMVIPEGGTNKLGIEGVEKWMRSFRVGKEDPDYICVAAGTGGTAAGIIKAFANAKTKVLVFSSLKGDFLNKEISKLTGGLEFELITKYHFGGYAKFSQELIDFIRNFHEINKILIEPIYTGKMMYGVKELIEGTYFSRSSNIWVLHTGGLQGINGYNYRYSKKFGVLPVA